MVGEYEMLMRSGDVLNTIGLLRALRIFGNRLTFPNWLGIVEDNYLVDDPSKEREKIAYLHKEATRVWNESRQLIAPFFTITSYTERLIQIEEKA